MSAVKRPFDPSILERPVTTVADMSASKVTGSNQPTATFESHVRLCSERSRSVLAGQLTVNAMKVTVGAATIPGPSGN